MARYCYCSRVLPGKEEAVREHWRDKDHDPCHEADDDAFWDAIGLDGFDSWLQCTDYGSFYIHCLEGASLDGIFQGLRQQIAAGNSIAHKLHSFYQDALGKDYRNPSAEPAIECLLDLSLPASTTSVLKRGYCWPLLDDKEEAHRQFRKECRGELRGRHEASMRAFDVSHLSVWLQTTAQEKFLVVYSARQGPDLNRDSGIASNEYQEIASILMDHTGLNQKQLLPEVEWLTASIG